MGLLAAMMAILNEIAPRWGLIGLIFLFGAIAGWFFWLSIS